MYHQSLHLQNVNDVQQSCKLFACK